MAERGIPKDDDRIEGKRLSGRTECRRIITFHASCRRQLAGTATIQRELMVVMSHVATPDGVLN